MPASGLAPARPPTSLRTHLARHTPHGVTARLTVLAACPPYTLDGGRPGVAAVRRACVPVFGRAPLLLPSGGSIPFVSDLAATTGVHTLLLGFGPPGDNIHAPNERFALRRLHRGTDTCVRLLAELGRG